MRPETTEQPTIAPLSPSDSIAVVYHNADILMPSHLLVGELREEGFEVSCENYTFLDGRKIFPEQESTITPYHFFAENPTQITQRIIDALRNPKVRMIVFPNGGNGMAEMVDLLEQERMKGNLPQRNDMFFVGFSDTEKATNYLANNGFGQAIVCYPVTGGNLTDLIQSLKQQQQQVQELKAVNQAARDYEDLSGYLISGVSEEHYESYCRIEPDEKGDIVFLERFPLTLKEQLETYAKEGKLGNIKAIMLSKNFTSSLEELDKEAAEIFEEYQIAPIPIYHGVGCGHNLTKKDSTFLPLRTRVQIVANQTQAEQTSFDMIISPLREIENIESVAKDFSQRERSIKTTELPLAEEYQAKETVEGVFCHAIRYPYGFRAEGVKNKIKENPDQKFPVTINIADFNGFDYDDLGMSWFKSLTQEEQNKFNSNEQVKMIQMCLMDLKISGYMDNISEVTISSRTGLTADTETWLQEFQQRILPETACKTAISGIENPLETAMKEQINARKQATKSAGDIPPTSTSPKETERLQSTETTLSH